MNQRYLRADEILAGMGPWLAYGIAPEKLPGSADQRTEGERIWDAAIMAAAEYVRRLTNYNEMLALTIHDLLTTKKKTGPKKPAAKKTKKGTRK